MTEFIQVPRSVLSKLWAPQPSGMQPGAKPSCQGRADSKHRTAAPDSHLTVCPWSRGWGGDWEGHRHLSITELVSAVPEVVKGSADGQRQQLPAA